MCFFLTRYKCTKTCEWVLRGVFTPLQRLFLFSCYAGILVTVPPNGLVVYCGTIMTEEGKEKKVNIDFEPFKPINTSLYLCDNKFHTEVRESEKH